MGKLYIAYGSNINLKQMAERCPDAKVVGVAELPGYELEFRGVATIVPKQTASVPVLLWEISEKDEENLNRFEGYPRLYRQEEITFPYNGKMVTGMAYLMNIGSIYPPSREYYNCIEEGYMANKMDTRPLMLAVIKTFVVEQQHRNELVAEQEDAMQMDLA